MITESSFLISRTEDNTLGFSLFFSLFAEFGFQVFDLTSISAPQSLQYVRMCFALH